MNRRVALISEHASPLATPGGVDSGGQNVYVGQVARHLAALGWTVDVFTRRDAVEPATIVPWAPGVRVIHVPAGPPEPVRKEDLLPFMPEFSAWMRRFRDGRRRGLARYGLVHANFFLSALVGCDLKRDLGLPLVVTFHALGRVRRRHQGGADSFPLARLAIEDQAVAEADRVIAECPQDALDLRQLYAAPAERLETIPCGFDPEEFGPMPRALARGRLGLDPHEPVLLQLGRMVPRKGVDTVIQALARLRRRHGVAARLLIVGGDSREPDPAHTSEIGRLQRIAAEEEVTDVVRFVGSRRRDELRQYYCAADLFVSTPWYEPFGITPVEAMACGTPVVGSAVGGIKTTVQDGRTGLLVPPRDPDALANRLAELLCDDRRRLAFGQRAIRRANRFYTWERVAHKIADVYEHVLATVPASMPVRGRPRTAAVVAATPAS